MFNLTAREKALRTILLDEAITENNFKMFVPEDGKNFLVALSLDADLSLATIQKKINSRSGLKLAQYPSLKVIIERAIAFYTKG